MPPFIAFTIAVGSSSYGSSFVRITSSQYSSAMRPIAGRFHASRPPPVLPSTQIFPAVFVCFVERFSEIGRVRVIDDRDELLILSRFDPFRAPGDAREFRERLSRCFTADTNKCRRPYRRKRVPDAECSRVGDIEPHAVIKE